MREYQTEMDRSSDERKVKLISGVFNVQKLIERIIDFFSLRGKFRFSDKLKIFILGAECVGKFCKHRACFFILEHLKH